MNRDELQHRADALRWYHTIDLGQGVVTRGVDNTPERLPRVQLPEDLSGRSVLDIGAWDGFFSFEAERRRAARVVACDYYSWHGVGWGTGQGKAGFELARKALNSRVEDVDLDVLNLSPDTVGTFDVVLFLGVLYHVKDPLACLERVASVTGEMMVIETETALDVLPWPVMRYYEGAELNNDPTNFWAPNRRALEAMFRDIGFRRFEIVTHPCLKPNWKRTRVVMHAWR
jgi:tRNA (mo5U34)-methyltransferase